MTQNGFVTNASHNLSIGRDTDKKFAGIALIPLDFMGIRRRNRVVLRVLFFMMVDAAGYLFLELTMG